MPTHYPDHADMPTRAAQTWPILTMLAHQHTTMIYGQLAALLGIHPHPIRYVLGYIMNYCQQQSLPPLTATIVSTTSGKPSTGLTTAPDQAAALNAVYAHNWWRIVPPTIAKLRPANQAPTAGAQP